MFDLSSRLLTSIGQQNDKDDHSESFSSYQSPSFSPDGSNLLAFARNARLGPHNASMALCRVNDWALMHRLSRSYCVNFPPPRFHFKFQWDGAASPANEQAEVLIPTVDSPQQVILSPWWVQPLSRTNQTPKWHY